MQTIRRLWASPRFRVMILAIVTAVATYITGIIAAGAPTP